MLASVRLARRTSGRAVNRWWLWSPGLAGVVAMGFAWTLAACVTQPASTVVPWALATTPYAAPPASVRGLQLPEDAQAVNELALALPAQVAGRVRLPQAERSGADGISLAYGELDGTSGQLPLRLDVLDVTRTATAYAAPAVADAVLRELNRARLTHGPWSGGATARSSGSNRAASAIGWSGAAQTDPGCSWSARPTPRNSTRC